VFQQYNERRGDRTLDPWIKSPSLYH